MNRTEKLLWQKIKGLLPGAVNRVENLACPGYPDAHGVFIGRDYWVELKVVNGKRAPENGTIVTLLRESQNAWGYNYLLNGGERFFVLLGYARGFALYKVCLGLSHHLAVLRLFDLQGRLSANIKENIIDLFKENVCR